MSCTSLPCALLPLRFFLFFLILILAFCTSLPYSLLPFGYLLCLFICLILSQDSIHVLVYYVYHCPFGLLSCLFD